MSLKKIVYWVCISLLTISVCWGQEQVLDNLILGKKLFWEAKFEESISHLKKVVESNTKNKEYLFEAYLYMGFSLARQNAHQAKIDSTFEQAIKIDPKRNLDELVIPPDLAEEFHNVRDKLVGCAYVNSEPIGAELMGVRGNNILFIETTPAHICELSATFQLHFSKQGYDGYVIPVKLKPGMVDTLFVKLNPLITQKSRGTKLWPWIGGGIVVSTAAVLFKTVIGGGGGNGGGVELEDLPGPPDRPTP